MLGFSRKALACALLAAIAVVPTKAAAQEEAGRAATFARIYNFPAATTSGINPAGGLLRNSTGHLFGTTLSGGTASGSCSDASGCGVIFRLNPSSNTLTVLHRFTNAQGDLSYSGLVQNSAGALFGTTYTGGMNDDGSVFQLLPPAPSGGGWRFKVIHHFALATSGGGPVDLLIDQNRNLYGMGSYGGTGGKGTVFKLFPPTSGRPNWFLRVLHNFGGANGDTPWGGLVANEDGSLYGTTSLGGTFNRGIIFRLTPRANGTYAFRVLHHFGASGSPGAHPNGTLVLRGGALFGTTSGGGNPHGDCDIGLPTSGCGIIFRLKLPATLAGNAVFNNLHTMDPGPEGGTPQNGLAVDANGVLYGVNYLTGPGANNGQGTLFRVIPPQPGQNWRFQTLHGFGGTPDGDDPTGTPLVAPNGVVYGTTQFGGTNNNGAIYSWRR